VGLQVEDVPAGLQPIHVIELMGNADGDGIIDADRPQQGGGLTAFEADVLVNGLVSGVLPHGAR